MTQWERIAVEGRQLLMPRGADPARFVQMQKQKAVMPATITEHGSVLVNCPYCIMYYREKNPIDVTRFVERDKEHTAECSKGHTVKFRQTAEWREERQKMGLQKR